MDIFDVIGPVMIGPSSSHTAGAVRMGRIASALLREPPVRAVIRLHGSFADTCKGHGTDRAIIGGLCGFDIDDERVRKGLDMASFEFFFERVDFKDTHPNTAEIFLKGRSESITVRCASIGGGRIEVLAIDGIEVSFNGDLDTLIVFHTDAKGAIADVTKMLANDGVNIATMRVFRVEKGMDAIMVIETDSRVSCAEEIEGLDCVTKVRVIRA